MNDLKDAGMWTGIGAGVTAITAFILRIVKQSRQDYRSDFALIIKNHAALVVRQDAEIKGLRLRIDAMENDHATCQQANLELRKSNMEMKVEIEKLKRRMDELGITRT